jgi:hypothetical protein
MRSFMTPANTILARSDSRGPARSFPPRRARATARSAEAPGACRRESRPRTHPPAPRHRKPILWRRGRAQRALDAPGDGVAVDVPFATFHGGWVARRQRSRRRSAPDRWNRRPRLLERLSEAVDLRVKLRGEKPAPRQSLASDCIEVAQPRRRIVERQ